MSAVEIPTQLLPLVVASARCRRAELVAELDGLDRFLKELESPTPETVGFDPSLELARVVPTESLTFAGSEADDDVAHDQPAAPEKATSVRQPKAKATSDDDFIAAWNASTSPAACAGALGMKLSTAHSRASILRKTRDVKRFPGGPSAKRLAAVTRSAAPPRRERSVETRPGDVTCLGCYVLVTPPKVRCAVCAEAWLKSRGEA